MNLVDLQCTLFQTNNFCKTMCARLRMHTCIVLYAVVLLRRNKSGMKDSVLSTVLYGTMPITENCFIEKLRFSVKKASLKKRWRLAKKRFKKRHCLGKPM